MRDLRELFLLDPSIVFLNHGSFGAVPESVFKEYQDWQKRIERQPVAFFSCDLPRELDTARDTLSSHFGVHQDDFVFVRNATYGTNIIARSLNLKAGDEVLTTDHEYGACLNALDYQCTKAGARLVRQHINVPVTDEAGIVDEIWAGVTSRTKAIFLSHITSISALRLPVDAVCRKARAEGIVCGVDGAHAPGQIELDVSSIDADFYVGNLHKWFMAPKGAGFLWTRRERQGQVEPLVVGHAYSLPRDQSPSYYLSASYNHGTDDYATYLASTHALSFQIDHDWPSVREACHDLLASFLVRCSSELGLTTLCPAESAFYSQMADVVLPIDQDLSALKERLYEKYRIEVPCMPWNKLKVLRVSVQGYNSAEDLDILFNALRLELPS